MTARRSFLARFGAAAAAFGVGSSFASAQPPAPPAPAAARPEGRWQPAREPKDDWYDQIPGKHRLFFDSVSPDGAGASIHFADNFFTGNKNGYGLDAPDVAVVICLRHRATQFAFNDTIWAKYGAALSAADKFVDPKTNQPPTLNLQRERLEPLIKRGLRLAVCNQSSRGYAGAIAMAMGLKQDDVFEEMKANLLPNARLVPAGIVAINRAQERGFSLASVEHS